ncbi:MAG TPA: transposase [Prosthecobacter sp.]|nr:transposase [Prosthecobacter sp.]HRK12886.1 transposase [Prosthecobacter sp.]
MSSKTCQPAGHATNLTDTQWALIEPFLFPAGAKRGRGRRREPHAARACLDAIRHLLKAGCQWSLPPGEFPPKSTVHDAFAAWTAQGLWPRINTALRGRCALRR